jgi:hypothetical protein
VGEATIWEIVPVCSERTHKIMFDGDVLMNPEKSAAVVGRLKSAAYLFESYLDLYAGVDYSTCAQVCVLSRWQVRLLLFLCPAI